MHRASSSYLIDCGDEGVLIDCGDGATRNFLHAGYRPEWIQHLILSHTHADHICGLPYFLQQRYLAQTESPLTIHCPEEAIAHLQQTFTFGYMFPERLKFEIRYEALEQRKEFAVAILKITPFETQHLTPNATIVAEQGYANRCQCFAMRIALPRHVLLYSADIGALDDLDLIPPPIDTLLIETSHCDLSDLWPWAAERKIKRIILTHIADTFDAAVLEEAPKYTDAEVLLAEDGMTLNLN